HQVYRINGLRPGPWDAHIRFETRWYHFTEDPLVLRWTAGDLDFRTCPDLAHGARFQVLDGDRTVEGDVTAPKGDDGAPIKGTYEITIHNVPFGLHSYAIRMEDLQGQPSRPASDGLIATPFREVLTLLVILAVILAVLVTLASVPLLIQLSRRALVRWGV